MSPGFSFSRFFHKRKQNNKVRLECLLFSVPPTLCTVIGAGGSLGPVPSLLALLFSANQGSIDDFIDGGLLVPGASDDELVVR